MTSETGSGPLVTCAMCGESVEPGDVCECGHATCPFCRDGRGSGSWGEPCPHWVVNWNDDNGVTEGPLAGTDSPAGTEWLEREPTESEVQAAFGDLAPLAFDVYEGSSFEAGDLLRVYEAVCDEQDGAWVSGLVTGMMISTAFVEVFVPDPERFEKRVQEVVSQLESGIDELLRVMGVPCPRCGERLTFSRCDGCGFVACPYCLSDGEMCPAGGGSEDQPCPHWVALWIDGEGFVSGPLVERDSPPEALVSREPTDAEVESVFGDLAPLTRRVYKDNGFLNQGSLLCLYREVCDEGLSIIIRSYSKGPPASVTRNVFALDPEHFANRLQELARRLAAGTERLPAAAEELGCGQSVPCPLCGEPVEPGEICDCDDPICPYCDDGKGGKIFDTAGSPCPHWIALWIDDQGFAEGPIEENQGPGPADISREPTESEVEAAFGDVVSLARYVYEDDGFQECGSLLRLYEWACAGDNGSIVRSDSEGPPGYVLRNVLAREPDRFRIRILELARKLDAGIERLPAVTRGATDL